MIRNESRSKVKKSLGNGELSSKYKRGAVICYHLYELERTTFYIFDMIVSEEKNLYLRTIPDHNEL